MMTSTSFDSIFGKNSYKKEFIERLQQQSAAKQSLFDHYFKKDKFAIHDLAIANVTRRNKKMVPYYIPTPSQFATFNITSTITAANQTPLTNPVTTITTSNLNSLLINSMVTASVPTTSIPTECNSWEYALKFIKSYMKSNCLGIDDLASYLGIDTALPKGKYKLPGGAVLEITDGNYKIDDSNHKTVYKAHTNRNFNEYLNVSDVLEKFMDYIASLKLTREQFMELPIRLFILWLIIEAAKKDGEPPPETEVNQLELALEPLKMTLPTKVAVMA